METIVDRLTLPNGDLARAWAAIAVPENVRDRLVARSPARRFRNSGARDRGGKPSRPRRRGAEMAHMAHRVAQLRRDRLFDADRYRVETGILSRGRTARIPRSD